MLYKKTLRTILKYKGQFLSMILMIILVVGIFAGLNAEWYSIKVNSQYFYEETNFADYRLVNKNGFNINDIEKISQIDGIDCASRFASFEVKNNETSIRISVTENENVSNIIVKEGDNYNNLDDNGIWVSPNYATKNNIKLGDVLSLSYLDRSISLKVNGFAYSSEYLINTSEGALMPNFSSYGYAYISPECLKQIIKTQVKSELTGANELVISSMVSNMLDRMYYQINILSDLSKEELGRKIDEMFEGIQIISKDDVISYSEVKGEENEGRTMGLILPVVFLVIALLIMVTTMNRITTNEKIQIGILKALGFKNRKILVHYTSYAFFIGILGSVIGILLGYGVAFFIINPNGAMSTYFEMPKWDIVFPWFVYVGIVIINVILIFIAFLSTKKILRGTASEALRPYEPKKMRSLLIEKTKIFHKLSFSARWNIRDAFRHLSRTLMTVFGVFGCILLLFASFGMLSTYNKFIDNYYNNSMNYDTKITLSEIANSEDLIEKYNADYSSSLPIKIDNRTYVLDIYNVENDLYRLLDENGKVIDKFNSSGAYICRRVSEKYNLKEGDTISFKTFSGNKQYTFNIVGVISSLTNGIVISKTYADDLNIDYKIDTLYTNVKSSDVITNKNIISIQSKQELIESFNSLSKVFNEMIIMLVLFSVILGFAVLYNLGVMSYQERYREIATLKVLGFKNKRLRSILISQNIVLTVLGIIVGIPGGHMTLRVLIDKLAADYEMVISYSSYVFIVSILVTMVVSFVVGYLISLKINKIYMVEALKSE